MRASIVDVRQWELLVRLILVALAVLRLSAQTRTFTTVLPALTYGPSCTSTLQIQNLADRTVTLNLEAHRESGALLPFGAWQECPITALLK